MHLCLRLSSQHRMCWFEHPWRVWVLHSCKGMLCPIQENFINLFRDVWWIALMFCFSCMDRFDTHFITNIVCLVATFFPYGPSCFIIDLHISSLRVSQQFIANIKKPIIYLWLLKPDVIYFHSDCDINFNFFTHWSADFSHSKFVYLPCILQMMFQCCSLYRLQDYA